MQPTIDTRVAATEDWLRQRLAAMGDAARGLDAQLAGVVAPPRLACGHCRRDWPTDTMACPECGGALLPLVPLVLQCGFCGAANRRDLTASCTACGGPLPPLPGGNPGDAPPPPPRRLPAVVLPPTGLMAENDRTVGLVFIIVGVLTLMFGLGLVFLAIGIWIRYGPEIRRHTKVAALANGHATRGTITAINTWSINGKPQLRLSYAFDDRGKRRTGTCKGFDPSLGLRAVGDEVWVVHVPGQGSFRSALWPPVY